MIKRLYYTFFALIAALGLMLGDINTVRAQEDDPDEFTLEEITVTAQKREENQQKVSVAMDVVTSQEIKDRGLNTLNEILSTVSAAIMQTGEDGLRISIRGINDYNVAPDAHAVAPPTVSINVDGVMSDSKDVGAGLYDIERVEILYGPQSTMYASQSHAGIVNVVTANPKLDDIGGSASLKLGNYSLEQAEGVMNIPLNETMAIRAAFASSVHDGYLTTGAEDEDRRSARLKGLWQPDDNLSILLAVEITKNASTGSLGGVVPFVNQDDVIDPWIGVSTGFTGVNDQRKEKYYGTLTWDMGFMTLTAEPSNTITTGYRETVVVSETDQDRRRLWRDEEEKMVELRLNSAEGSKIEWLAGYVFFRGYDGQIMKSIEYIETGDGNHKRRSQIHRQSSVFANLTYSLTDTTRLVGGLRKSDDTYVMSQIGSGTFDTRYVSRMVDYETVQTMVSPDKPDWRFGVEYDLRENSMAYFTYSTAYRVQSVYRDLKDPEILHSYSIGSKNRFFGNKLQINGSGYYYDYQNYLCRRSISRWISLDNSTADEDGVISPGTDDRVSDYGASQQGNGRMFGFDIQSNAIITPKDRLDLDISYLNSKWDYLYFDFEYDEEYEWDDETMSVITVPVVDEDYSGKPMTLAPEWTIKASYTHTFNLKNGATLSGTLESSFQSGYQITWPDYEQPWNLQESHHIENLTATYTDPSGKWIVSGFIRNAFEYAPKLMYRTGRSQYLTIGPPRTYGFVLTVNY